MNDQLFNREEIFKKPRELPQELAFLGIDDSDKIEQFEKSLESCIEQTDSIGEAVEKIVKAALAVEFGDKILSPKHGVNMVKVISQSILSDNELRKQTLIIMDKFAKPKELNA